MLTSGGVSVGVADHMKSILGRLSGGAVHWMEVAIKPAKPFGFAVLSPSGVPVLCMPGNPVSAMVSFELLARPALRYMMGHRTLDRPALPATAEERLVRTATARSIFSVSSPVSTARGTYGCGLRAGRAPTSCAP